MSANQIPRRAQSIKPYMGLVDAGAFIEFTPPKAIVAKDIPSEKIPKRYRLPTGKRILHIELYLPGLKSIPEEWQQPKSLKWPMRMFSCRAVTDSSNQPCFGGPFSKITDKRGSKYTNTALTTCPHDKWCRANPNEQPKNGELWYRLTADRIQISILLELKTGTLVHEENTLMGPRRLSTESLLTSSESSAVSVTSITRCPHYYYWDSGKLTHPIDFQASRLIVANGKITCYFVVCEINKQRPVWSKEELDHLESVSLNLDLVDEKMRKMVARRSTTHNYKTVPAALDSSLIPSCNLLVSADEADQMFYQVTLNRKPGQSLGLTLVERSLPSSCAPINSYPSPSTGLFVKCITSGGLAEQSNKLKVGDQVLAINSVSVLVSSPSTDSKRNSVALLSDNSKCDNPSLKAVLQDNTFSGQVKATDTRSTESVTKSLAAGFTAYPFAMRLLRQTIGPVHLYMKRIEPTRSYVYPSETETTSDKLATLGNKLVAPLFGTQSEEIPVKPNTFNRELNASEEDPIRNDMVDVDILHSQLIAQADEMLANYFQWMDRKQGEKLIGKQEKTEIIKAPTEPTAVDNRKQTIRRKPARSSVAVRESTHREHKHKDERISRTGSYNRTVLAKSSPRIVAQNFERRRNDLRTTNLLEQRTQRIHGTTKRRTASIMRRQNETSGFQKQNESKNKEESAKTLSTKQPAASLQTNELGQSKLQERLTALEEYFSKNMPPVLLSTDSSADMNEVNAFHEILENLTDEEWDVLLRVVMQPDDLIQERLVSKMVSDNTTSKPILDTQPLLTDQFVSATKEQKPSNISQSHSKTTINVSGSLPAGTKSRKCVNPGHSSGDVYHRNKTHL
ncbi:hypothetical protein PHET_03374 [Paragonimus heterotremus]|uniref:PDZ domain-containing protein n=1 Tax=Paragonimus heterotremus TaxID=100268 RepID=A0A8J4TIV0_9TREM|nr:hypothetical protein PHET_03374 [Paragonimus heterotremus]